MQKNNRSMVFEWENRRSKTNKYPPVNQHGNGISMKIPISCRKYIFQWSIFHCYVSLPGGKHPTQLHFPRKMIGVISRDDLPRPVISKSNDESRKLKIMISKNVSISPHHSSSSPRFPQSFHWKMFFAVEVGLDFPQENPQQFHIPSVGLVYLLTWMVAFYGS